MKILDKGHKYKLFTLDGKLNQTLTFVKRKDKNGENRFPGNNSSYPGTNIQDVLRVLIDRVEYLHEQKPHITNKSLVYFLKGAMYCLELRAAELHKRVLDVDSFEVITDYPFCKTCGHIQCNIH